MTCSWKEVGKVHLGKADNRQTGFINLFFQSGVLEVFFSPPSTSPRQQSPALHMSRQRTSPRCRCWQVPEGGLP